MYWYKYVHIWPHIDTSNSVGTSLFTLCNNNNHLFLLSISIYVMTSSSGLEGRPGNPGHKGLPGLPGLPGRDLPCFVDSFMITRHSQSIHVPDCPYGSTLTYSGYSLLFINGNERTHGQDLGKSMETTQYCAGSVQWNIKTFLCLSSNTWNCLRHNGKLPPSFLHHALPVLWHRK